MLQTIFSNLLLSPRLIMYTIALIVVFFSVSKVNLSVHEDKNRVPYVKVSGGHLDVLDLFEGLVTFSTLLPTHKVASAAIVC